MPLVKARGKSDASVNKAVTKNIAILINENANRPKPRPYKQVVAIAEKFARRQKK